MKLLKGQQTNIFQGFFDEYDQNVAYSLDWNATSKIVEFTFVDLAGTANDFRLQVFYLIGESSRY